MERISTFFTMGAVVLFLSACSGDPDPDPCATPPQITNAAVTAASCGGETGGLAVTATGGNGTLRYSLDGAAPQQSNQFSNLAAGTYTLSVQDEKNCKTEQQIVIGEGSTLTASLSSSTNTGCGTREGTAQISGSGGEGAYTYSLDGVNYHTEGQFRNLAAGNHTAYVKDAAGCVTTTTFGLKTGISFENSVKSIIDTNCAVAGCHVAGTGRGNFTEFSEIKNKAGSIKTRTTNKTMPPPGSGKTLTANEISAIACWVDDGAPKN